MQRLETLVKRLREQGYRLTPQRLEILKIIVSSDSHPSAEQIYAQVKPTFPMTSLATVYKTIQMLKDMHEIVEISQGDGAARYDGVNATPHAHLICVRCGRILDADLVNLKQLGQQLMNVSGFEILNQRLDFFGLCPECQGLPPVNPIS